MPQASVAEHTFAWHYKGRKVMGIKQIVRECMAPSGDTENAEQGHELMHHVRDRKEDPHLSKLWAHGVFRHLRE